MFRILVAQAINHRLVLISRDSAFDAYSIHPGDNLAIGKCDALWRGGGGVGEMDHATASGAKTDNFTASCKNYPSYLPRRW